MNSVTILFVLISLLFATLTKSLSVMEDTFDPFNSEKRDFSHEAVITSIG